MTRPLKAAARFSLALLLGGLYGCQAPSIPDPNDPSIPGPKQSKVLQNSLVWASDAANERVIKGQISQQQAKELVSSYALGLTKDINLKTIPKDEAYLFGNIFLTACQWEKAKEVLEVAVKNATNEDRRVNDSLRLAEAYAQLGQVQKAIEVAKSTFSTDRNDKAPILPAVLYKIVPAGQGKGSDEQLADLLKASIYEHEQNVVNPSTEAGKMFLLARPAHVRRAWSMVVTLYNNANRPDLAQKAEAEARKNLDKIAAV
jgi:tetratricopeptide (TPR) repeat protein